MTAEDYVFQILSSMCFPLPEREFRFHPVRRWRFDFAWPKQKLALEVEGGVYVKGRHVRPRGYENDLEKYNEAARLGWVVLRFTPQMVKRDLEGFVQLIGEMLNRRKEEGR